MGEPATASEGLDELPDDAWISFLVRAGRLISVSRDTVLHAGDDVLILADPDRHHQLHALFERPANQPSA